LKSDFVGVTTDEGDFHRGENSCPQETNKTALTKEDLRRKFDKISGKPFCTLPKRCRGFIW